VRERGLDARTKLIAELRLQADSGYPLIYLLTHEEDRARRLVVEAFHGGPQKVVVWSSTGGLKSEEGGRDPVRMLSSFRAPGPGVTILLDFHNHLGDPQVVRRLRDVVPACARAGHLLVIVSPVLVIPAELEKDLSVLELPMPSRAELDAQLRAICAAEQVIFPEEFIAALVRAAQGLTEIEAQRVFTKALRKGGGFELDDVTLVLEEKKKSIRKSEVLEFWELDESLAEVGGLEEVKLWLAAREQAFGDEAERYGLPAPKGLLLIGVQGCGKSLTAKAVAGSWKLPLLRLDLGSVFGGGSPETAIRRAILVAESLAPVVLWVDEIEKGFAEAAGGGSARVFGAFITWLQEKKAPVFVVATANEVEHLPPELLRKGRFDELFFVDLPDAHERLAILKVHVRKRGRDPAAFELEAIARAAEHFSGAELEQGVVAGLYRAFGQGRELESLDIQKELDEIVPLYATYEEKIKTLREWARTRARRANRDHTLVDLFERE
jgi:ATP-dependent 26S proteasome regulatory subunit